MITDIYIYIFIHSYDDIQSCIHIVTYTYNYIYIKLHILYTKYTRVYMYVHMEVSENWLYRSIPQKSIMSEGKT